MSGDRPSRTHSDLPMGVQRIARSDVVTATPDTPLRDLAREMYDRNVGSVVIVHDDAVVGIVTDRDLAIELLAEGGDVDLFDPDVTVDEVTAADVMTADPLTAEEDDRLPRVLHHMSEARARRIPIVDGEGRPTGILTLDDVVVHLAGESTHVSAQLDNVAGVIRSESPGS